MKSRFLLILGPLIIYAAFGIINIGDRSDVKYHISKTLKSRRGSIPVEQKSDLKWQDNQNRENKAKRVVEQRNSNVKKLEEERAKQEEEKNSLGTLLRNLDCVNELSYNSSRVREHYQDFLSNTGILERTADCSGYPGMMSTLNVSPPSKEELSFPLAFAHTVHTDIGIFELLLSLLFRPSDAHCIHIDAKADKIVQASVRGLVQCYNQIFPASKVFVASQSASVVWRFAGSIMEADKICFAELQKVGIGWNYVLNLAGTELPMVSIQRIREKLKDNKNKANVMDTTADNYFRVRQTFYYDYATYIT